MRILIVGAHGSVVGGAEAYQRSLIPALRERGHEVALLHETAAAGGRADVVPVGTVDIWCADELGASAALDAAIGWKPDVAYAQGLASPALEASLLERVPTALFAHDYYGTCATGTKRHAFPRVQFCSRRFGPACLALHYPRRCGGLGPATALRLYRLQARRNALLRRYRAVLVASRHMEAEFLQHGVRRDRLHRTPLAPTGIEPQPESPAPRPPSNRVIMLGRLTELKGGRLLVAAIGSANKQLGRALTLVVAGDGPERIPMEREAVQLGVAAEFHDWLDPAARNRLLREADALGMPSAWPEPWGLAGLEAACLGVPTVAYASGGIPDWLAAGTTGELAPGDPPKADALGAALVRALADPQHHQSLREGAWRRSQEFTMEGHLDRLEAILR